MTPNLTLSEQLNERPFLNSFPNNEVEAKYHQFYFMIELNEITKAQLKDIDENGLTLDNYFDAATFKHELCHYIDHIGSLWGQRNVGMIYNALNALALGDVEEYWRIRSVYQSAKADEFGIYYKETYVDYDATFKDPWKTNVSCGVRFDMNGKIDYDLPVLFANYLKPDGTKIARTPISVAALEETNAIFQEYLLKRQFVEQLKDEPVKKNEMAKITQEIEYTLYSTDCALYSVVAHLAAENHGLSDVLEIYRLASALSTISLNLPEKAISGMRIKAYSDVEWNRRFRALAANSDRGFAYYRLNENLKDFFGPNNYSLENALEASGLKNAKAMEMEVMSEMMFNMHGLLPGPYYGAAEYLLNCGMQIFAKRGLDGQSEDAKEWLNAEKFYPHILFKDSFFNPDDYDLEEVVIKFRETDGDLELPEHFKMFSYYNNKMNEFNDACGI